MSEHVVVFLVSLPMALIVARWWHLELRERAARRAYREELVIRRLTEMLKHPDLFQGVHPASLRPRCCAKHSARFDRAYAEARRRLEYGSPS